MARGPRRDGAFAPPDGRAGHWQRHRGPRARRLLLRLRTGGGNASGPPAPSGSVRSPAAEGRAMNRTRRTRSLTPEERKLWAHVAREIAPLKGRSLAEEPEPEPSAPAQPAAKAEPPPSAPAARP